MSTDNQLITQIDIPIVVAGASRFASRKFGLAAVALLAVIVFFALERLTQDAFITAVQWILGLYFGANVAQKATDKTP